MSTRANHPAGASQAWKWAAAALTAITVTLALGACGDDSNGDTADADAADAGTSEGDIEVEFPITIDASLEGYDLVGAYTLSMTEAYCDALPGCGTNPADVRADIVQGSNGLELQVPNVFTAGLFSINGSLFAVTDSNAIVQPCGETPVNAQISITMFADGVSFQEDGTKTLSGIGASLLVAADPAGDCDSGNVFYAAQLTPA